MARPSSTPRLRDLVPQQIGDDVLRLVTDHMCRLAFLIDPTHPMPVAGELSTLRWSTQLLTGYAQIGLRATDWPDHGCARDAIQEICEALYSCAGTPGSFGIGVIDGELDPREPIDIVLLAAWCRVAIDNRERIDARMLACLAGVDPDHVRLLGRRDELAIVDGVIKPREARRWLMARGVEGL